MSYFLNTHDTEKGKVVAACDTEVLGEQFSEGEVTLHVETDFYRGDEASFADIVRAMQDAATTNFVGEQLINELLENDLIQEAEVETIDGTPHVHLYFI